MEKQNKSIGKTVLVVLLLIVTIVSLILATYAWAKYTAKETGTATANVAKWDVSLTSNDSSFTGSYKHVLTGKIAPGTSGSFDVTIDPGASEVCVAYSVTIDDIKYALGSGATVTEIDHLRFFTSNSYAKDTELKKDGQAFTGVIDLTSHNTGAGTPVTKTIYWVWPYDFEDAKAKFGDANVSELDATAYDDVDTKIGEGDVTSVTIDFTLRAWQVAPDDANETDAGSKTQTTNKP